jgi:hypothetical protein
MIVTAHEAGSPPELDPVRHCVSASTPNFQAVVEAMALRKPTRGILVVPPTAKPARPPDKYLIKSRLLITLFLLVNNGQLHRASALK